MTTEQPYIWLGLYQNRFLNDLQLHASRQDGTNGITIGAECHLSQPEHQIQLFRL